MLLAGEQQAAVTVAVEGLMDGKPLPELESFLTLDPKVSAASAFCSITTQSLVEKSLTILLHLHLEVGH